MCAYPDPIFAPPRIYVLQDVYGNPDAAKRADRICTSFPNAEVRRFTYADFPEIVKEEGWGTTPRMGELDHVPPPIPVLNLHRFDREAVARDTKKMQDAYDGPGSYRFHVVAGGQNFRYFSSGLGRQCRMNPQHVCRPGWRINLGAGCPHQCAYCGLGYSMISGINTDEYIEHLAKLIKQNPWQTTYLYDDVMDVLAIEPQWDTVPPLMRFFEKLGDRYLILHTKSDRAQALVEANAPKNTIIAWSLSAKTQSTKLEPMTGNTEQRIAAGRICQEAGMTVRFKFKPIIPVKGWREESAEMMERLFAEVRPDNLSMTTMVWFQLDAMKRCIPPDMLDPELLAMAEAAEPEMRDSKVGPFPDDAREIVYRHYLAEVRKHDAEVPVTISTESASMWKRMGSALGFTPANYVCGCGMNSNPGMKELDKNPWEVARDSRDWDGTPAVEDEPDIE